jgi:hypothetical protein
VRLGPADMSLRTDVVGHDRLETGAMGGRDFHGDPLAQTASMARWPR